MKTLSDLVLSFKKERSDYRALKKKHDGGTKILTYSQLYDEIFILASYLIKIGVKKGDRVALLSDNRMEWMISDLACQVIGAVDVPRGANITSDEIAYILNHAEVNYIFAENTYVYKKIKDAKDIPEIKKIILFDKKENVNDKNINTINEAFDIGHNYLNEIGFKQIEKLASEVDENDLATIIYTSGTTGVPKGVMLTHFNLVQDIIRLPVLANIAPKDKFLAILPTWHSYERTVEYTVLYIRGEIVYSKPVPTVLLQDFKEENPQFLASVPRVWEGIYNGILKKLKQKGSVTFGLFKFFRFFAKLKFIALGNLKFLFPLYSYGAKFRTILFYPIYLILLILVYPFYLLGDIILFKKLRAAVGNSFKAGISGGGALQRVVDEFFNSIGITVLEGYGLTETSPVVAVRNIFHPIYYTIGDTLEDVVVEIRDENGKKLKPGQKGIVWIKGPIIMKGYYKRSDETKKVIVDGWFNSGDIAKMDIRGYVKITGRAKSTIVLLGGENIEPEPIEEKLLESSFIKTAVVVGQDKRTLGVLIVPEFENVANFLKHKHINIDFSKSGAKKQIIENEHVKNLIKHEIHHLISTKNGFKRYELIGGFKLLENEFEEGVELTQTLKLKRQIIQDKYKKEIESIFRK